LYIIKKINKETIQVKCQNKDKNQIAEKCQKIFKNIMALNVHLQMYHKETGIITVSSHSFNKDFDQCEYLGFE